MKNPAQSFDPAISGRRRFRDLLWRAFPSDSERALAQRAAPVLGVSERQVINWLREEHGASVDHVWKVIVLAGAEVVIRRIAA